MASVTAGGIAAATATTTRAGRGIAMVRPGTDPGGIVDVPRARERAGRADASEESGRWPESMLQCPMFPFPEPGQELRGFERPKSAGRTI